MGLLQLLELWRLPLRVSASASLPVLASVAFWADAATFASSGFMSCPDWAATPASAEWIAAAIGVFGAVASAFLACLPLSSPSAFLPAFGAFLASDFCVSFGSAFGAAVVSVFASFDASKAAGPNFARSA